MKGLLTLITILLMIGPGDIAKINSLKAEAKKAYLSGDYETAIKKYRYLVDSAQVQEDEVMMNLAGSYFQRNDTTNAVNAYTPVTQSQNNKLRSIANQQLGILNNREGKYEEALQYFKQAIKSDATNDEARYNYEMLKKKLEEKKKEDEKKNKDKNKDNKDQKQEQDQENKDKESEDKKKQDQENKDQKDEKSKEDQEKEDQEKKDEEKKDPQQKDKEQKDSEEKNEMPPSVKDKLKDMEMTEEKAQMILEAMKNQEKQYLQQNKRKGTKPKDKGKPDW